MPSTLQLLRPVTPDVADFLVADNGDDVSQFLVLHATWGWKAGDGSLKMAASFRVMVDTLTCCAVARSLMYVVTVSALPGKAAPVGEAPQRPANACRP